MLTYALLALFFLGLTLILILFLFLFQPRWMFFIVTLIFPGVIYFAQAHGKVVALTIDDSPDPNTTPKILDILQQNQAKATFFVISEQVSSNKEIVAQIIAQGHELGNHLTRDEPSIKLSPTEFEANLLEAHHTLAQFSIPHWLRPASGFYNSMMIDIARKYEYQVALGSIFPFDTHIHSPWFASNHILFNVRPGAIIILHDNGNRGERTALTLTRVLPELCRRGYRVVTLSELFS